MERKTCHSFAPLEATSTFRLSFHAMELLCAQCLWQISFFELEATRRPLSGVFPGIVTATAFGSDHPVMHDLNPQRQRRAEQTTTRHVQQPQQGPGSEHAQSKSTPHHNPTSRPDDNCIDDSDDDDDTHSAVGDAEYLDDLALKAETLLGLGLYDEEALQEKGTPGAASSCDTRLDAVRESQNVVVQPTSASDGVAPQPLDVAPAEPVPTDAPPRRRGTRQVQSTHNGEIKVSNGRIAYYANRHSIEAMCSVHEGCKLTRATTGRTVKGFKDRQGGRPLGMFMLWLELANNYATADEHKDKSNFVLFDHASRSSARDRLLGVEGGLELAASERPKAKDTDPDEPLELLGMD
eukprot:5008484-Amphidinium_carterae.1